LSKKILSYSPAVKEKIAFENGLRFQAQVERQLKHNQGRRDDNHPRLVEVLHRSIMIVA
jgi:hypothetical protein